MRTGIGRMLRITGATAEEVAASSPADALIPEPTDRWVRCITVRASRAVVYRWLCQFTVAPYSFDVIDFFGRMSPGRLTPGADELRVGQSFLIFSITGFRPEEYIAGFSRPEFRGSYGEISVSYSVEETAAGTTRLRANACLGEGLGPVGRTLLAAGDLVMSTRQLYRIRRLCERAQSRGREGGRMR